MILLCSWQLGFATITTRDSLRQLIPEKASQPLQGQIDFYRALGEAYKLDTSDSSIYFLKKAADLAKRKDDPIDLGYILTDIGRAYERGGQHLEALDYFQRGYAIIREEEENVPPYLLIDIGNIYFNEEVYSIAQSYYDKAEALFLVQRDTNGILLAWKNKGLIYKQQSLCDSAVTYFEKVLEVERSRSGGLFEKALTYNYLARSYNCSSNRTGRLTYVDSAIYYMEKAGGVKKSPYVWASLHFNAAYTSIFDNLSQAESYYRQFEEILDDYPKLEASFSYNRLIYAKAVAKERGDYDAAIRLSHQILRDSLAPPHYLPQQYSILASLYEAKGDTKEALAYLKKFAELIEQRNKDKFAKKVVEMYAAMENFEQRRALTVKEMALQQERLLKEQEQRTRQLYALGAGVLLILLLLSLWLYRRLHLSKDELSKQKQVIEENAAALRELNTTKDKLMSILAHDLRGPFSNMLSLSTSLEEHLSQQPTASGLQREAKSLSQTAKGSYLLFEDLLSWSKNQAGELRFVPEVLSISRVCADVLPVFEGQITEKKLTIETNWQLLGLYADRNMLQTMLRNLIGNACRHSAYQDTIYLHSGADGTDAWLEVRDEAGGLAEQEAAQVFSEERWKQRRGNSGLGLVLCQQFMERHGGHIELNNELGKGATFRLYFPQRAKKQDFANEELKKVHAIEPLLEPKELQKQSLALRNLIKLPIYHATQFIRLRNQLEEPLSTELYQYVERLQEAMFTQDRTSYTRLQNYLSEQLAEPDLKGFWHSNHSE